MSKNESQEQAQGMDSAMDGALEAETAPAPRASGADGKGASLPDGTLPPGAEAPQGDVKRTTADVTINPASFADLRPQSNGRKEKASLDMLLDIGLQVTVELGRAKMNIREVLTVGPGTVVELNRVAGEPVDILINGKPIAKGEVVVIGDMFGVRVTDILPPAQRVQSMM